MQTKWLNKSDITREKSFQRKIELWHFDEIYKVKTKNMHEWIIHKKVIKMHLENILGEGGSIQFNFFSAYQKKNARNHTI